MKLLLIFFLFLKGHYTFADEFPNLFACFCEGGLITGVAGKNDKILIDGVEIKTFENGEFIFAFGRKYKDTIKVKFNDKLKIFRIKKKRKNQYLIWDQMMELFYIISRNLIGKF